MNNLETTHKGEVMPLKTLAVKYSLVIGGIQSNRSRNGAVKLMFSNSQSSFRSLQYLTNRSNHVFRYFLSSRKPLQVTDKDKKYLNYLFGKTAIFRINNLKNNTKLQIVVLILGIK